MMSRKFNENVVEDAALAWLSTAPLRGPALADGGDAGAGRIDLERLKRADVARWLGPVVGNGCSGNSSNRRGVDDDRGDK